MKNAYLYKSSFVIKIALGIAILLILYITGIFFTQMQNLGASVDSISTSNKKLVECEKILTAISINESSVRSFIITGDSTYLQKRYISRQDLRPHIEKLRALTSQSASKNFTCDSLEQLLAKRYYLFRKVLKSSESKLPSNINAALSEGDSVTDQIRSYVHRSMDDEISNVKRSTINHHYEIETSILTSFLLVTVALFILLLSLNRINSDLKNLKKLNDELQFVNYTFNNAEKIAGISHWKYNLRTKKYTFSENFYNLIGTDPESFEPDMENLLPYVHPDDRQYVFDAYSGSLQNKTPLSIIFRLYRANGEMKYIKSVGSFAENSQGQMVKIGVNYDITDQYQNTLTLEESNKNLIAINAELESFNNIVSHDLQEPLRKIQMFISRISDGEMKALSPTGRDYFGRIAVSANRMQNLLIDLVNYSRTIKGDKTFVETKINVIVDDVLSELAINIKEKNAQVEVDVLPEICVIPFQIHQLFVNLITNALKFSKDDAARVIRISSSEINSTDLDQAGIPEGIYHKIVVADNGIGFKQEFAEKIFQLFRRLEKESYQGTGIGLAICKKIVENHNGIILAEGNLGEGAKFNIYLPKQSK